MTIKIDEPNLKKTVTAGDANPNPNSFGMLTLFPYFQFGRRLNTQALLPPLPEYWTPTRDFILAATMDMPGFWSAAVGIAISQLAAKAYDLEGEVPLQIKRAHELFEDANAGEGWHHFISQHLADFFCTDNGGFIEIERASDSPAAKIIGIHHLDSLRVRRTGNTETPYIYFNRYTGEWHFLKWYQCFSISDMPNARSNYFSVGHCAASRAYERIRRLQAEEKYIYEKVTGNNPQELHFLTGISDEALSNIFESNAAQRNAKGLQVYGGAAFVAFMSRENISHVNVPIASLPDKFDSQIELNQSLLLYANALGIDPQDLQPLASSNLGTSTQSQVLNQKAKGRGAALWMQRWTHFVNKWLLPNQTRWIFVEKDLDDNQKEAGVANTWATAIAALVDKGVITGAQGLQKLVDEKQLPKEFLQVDLTADATVADTEKPEMELPLAQEQMLPQPGQAQSQFAQQAQPIIQQLQARLGKEHKEAGDGEKLVAQEESKAKKIYEAIISGRTAA